MDGSVELGEAEVGVGVGVRVGTGVAVAAGLSSIFKQPPSAVLVSTMRCENKRILLIMAGSPDVSAKLSITLDRPPRLSQ